MTPPRPQERSARWLLLLALLHTVPVVWITLVAGGTAPTAALLALGFASLLSFEREDMAFALFALAPALLYCGIGWILAWWFAKLLERMRKPMRPALQSGNFFIGVLGGRFQFLLHRLDKGFGS